MKKPDIKRDKGAVTFIDVLGWKGIWQQTDFAIETLFSLINETMEKAKIISQEYSNIEELRGKEEITKVISVSDTIVLFTSGPSNVVIEIHAKICAWLLPYALELELPLRGAISYGEYSTKANIMVGYAVDEAASWHETTDWIGVVLTPSAQMKLNNQELVGVTSYENIPFKNGTKNLQKCVDWNFRDMDRLFDVISKKGPHTPEIAKKYLNTLDFLARPENN
jgi:hypothetical protein